MTVPEYISYGIASGMFCRFAWSISLALWEIASSTVRAV